MKRCSKCGAEKRESEFHPTYRKDGRLRSQCKACCSDSRRKWLSEHADDKRRSNKRWAEANAERKRELDRNWRRRHASPSVYQIVLPSGSVYFGSTSNPSMRFHEHKSKIANGTQRNPHLRMESLGHGPDEFRIEVLMVFESVEEARLAERVLIERNECVNVVRSFSDALDAYGVAA